MPAFVYYIDPCFELKLHCVYTLCTVKKTIDAGFGHMTGIRRQRPVRLLSSLRMVKAHLATPTTKNGKHGTVNSKDKPSMYMTSPLKWKSTVI